MKPKASASRKKPARKRQPLATVVRHQIPDHERDDDLVEEWTRQIDDRALRYIHGVGAAKRRSKGPWRWRITVWVMEFVRDGSLQTDLSNQITDAVRGVEGVTDVAHENREVWAVAGSPDGASLVTGVARVVDLFADRTRNMVRSR